MVWELETKVIVSVLLIFGVFSGVMYYFADVNEKYDTYDSYDNNTALSQTMTGVFSTTSSAVNDISEGTAALGSGNLLDILGGLVQSVVGLLKGLLTSFVGIGAIGASLLNLFGLGPAAALYTGILLLIVLIVFAISVVLRRIRGT